MRYLLLLMMFVGHLFAGTTYYVAANGSDSNNGTSKATPWLHAPMMPNCSGTCATVQAAKIPAGTSVIFRGGDSWHFGISTDSAGQPSSGGTLNFNVSPFPTGSSFVIGTGAIYYGVDQTWFSGASWQRPIWDGDNPACNANTLGSNCHQGVGQTTVNVVGTAVTWVSGPTFSDLSTNQIVEIASASCNPNCKVSTVNSSTSVTLTSNANSVSGVLMTRLTGNFYVDTCAHQNGANNLFIEMGGNIGYFIIDNIEMTGLCQSNIGQPGAKDHYINYNQTGHPDQFSNLYIHNATHLPFVGANGSSSCTASVVCFNIFVFDGYVNALIPGEIVNNNYVDFSDSDGMGVGLCYCGFYETYNNYFAYTSQGIERDLHEFFNNWYGYFFENGHSNVIEDAETSPAGAIFNNVFAHIETSGLINGVLIWPGPINNTDVNYTFNNLAYDVGNVQYFNLGGLGIGTNNGSYNIWNNTFQTNVNQPIIRANGSPLGTVNTANNHYIDDGTVVLGTGVTTSVTNLTRTNAQATSDGYTSAETMPYSPPLASSITVRAGTNEGSVNSAWCSALTTAGLTNAAAACVTGTGYACTINTTNHTVSCPAITAVSRPSVGAWDIGAWQFAYPFTFNAAGVTFAGAGPN